MIGGNRRFIRPRPEIGRGRRLVAFCLLAIAFACCAAPLQARAEETAAEGSLGIDPAKQEIDIDAGKVSEGSFKVISTWSAPLKVRVYAEPLPLSENGAPDKEAETMRTQIARWVAFDTDELTIPAGGQVEVPYRVSVPEDIPDGGQYAVLFVEEAEPRGEGVNVISRVGMLLYAHPLGRTRESGEVLSADLGGFWRLHGPVTTSAETLNSGNVDAEFTAELSVRDRLSGRALYRSDAAPVVLLPGARGELTASWETVPVFGLFRITQTIKGPGLESAGSRTIIVAPLWALIAALALIAFIVVQAIYLSHLKRVKRAIIQKEQNEEDSF
jgi:hypothetical protein